MKSYLFKPEDFIIDQRDASLIEIADQANAKLQELIKASPVVYAECIQEPFFKQWYNVSYQGATHQARLMFIEKLPVKECEHQPAYIFDFKTYCKCGVELKATWSAV